MLFIILYIIFALVIFNVIFKVYVKFNTMSCKNKVCLVGKTVIVTGSNTGIGYETALECAKRGARVIIACRDHRKGTVAVQNIKTLTQNQNIVLKIVDLASLTSVKNFATNILQTEEKLDILINNAGTLMLGDQLTEDGFQLEMQINYFGPVLLTLMLVNLLKKSTASRIINVASEAAKYARLDVKNLNGKPNYPTAKLCNILFTQELAKRLNEFNISVFALHPGMIATDIITRHLSPVVYSGVAPLSKFLFKTPEEGAQTTIYVATEPGIEYLTGGFFSECHYQEHYKTARDPELARQLWDETIKLLNYND
ncbi:retinol dehydrogenase 11-like [Diabrotica undecimpunctata]|uniref:retinol dehydrogenase 11-like n=1 Tax=Diabrotica undecimpunctata TaxID=50387 RepID=UPI003B632719